MSTLQVASRLVELNLQIRAEFRGPLPSSGVQPQETDSEEDISRPVKNSGPFAAPAATQLPPQLQPSSESLALHQWKLTITQWTCLTCRWIHMSLAMLALVNPL